MSNSNSREELSSIINDLKNLSRGLRDLQEKIAREEISKIKRQVPDDIKKKHKAR